jgi:phage tail tape-measure protein
MANGLALGLVIGGAVSASVGKAFNDVEGRIKRLDNTAAKTKVLQSVVGETKRLQEEWRKAHTSGSATADGLRRKLEANLDALKRQGVEVNNLGKAYQRLGREARSAELKSKGQAQLREGGAGLRSVGVGVAAGAAAMVLPAKVSADYNAIIRDIAIKAGIANQPQEAQVSNKIIDTSRDTGMARNQVADLVNALVGAGMDLNKAMEYAPVAAKFVVGQGADGVDTAKMINALGQNAKITDPAQLQQALEAIAFQGQAGSFEASDMAKWFPELLAGMGKLGITGNDAVTQLGAMLQVQMKTAGSSDEAANNLKNWMEKIGSGEVVKAYKDAGIDYQASMNTGLQKGQSTLESSFALAQKYVEATDPKKAALMAKSVAQITQEADPAKAKEMMSSLEQALRTGDLFADMQVKAALTAYMQNKALYEQLKKDSAGAKGILDKNLAERRETSAQKWSEAGQGADDALRSIGDALQPITDRVATSVATVSRSLGELADKSPQVVSGVVAVGGAVAALAGLYSSAKVIRGVMNIGRGSLMGNPNVVQKVEVVNSLGLGGGSSGPDGGSGGAREGARGRGRRRWWGGRKRELEPPSASPAPGAAKPRVQVYSNGTAVPPKSGALSSWKPPTSAPVATGAGSARSLVPSTKAPRAPRLGGELRGSVPAELFNAVLQAKEVYDTAETQDEKAEGYGEAAGSLAGTLAGAAAGAAIGSAVPIIGTAIGGLIGAYLGSRGGGALGGYTGKALFGTDLSKAQPTTPMLMTARPGPAIPSLSQFGAAYGPPGTGGVTRNGSGGGVMAELMKKPDAQSPVLSLLSPAKVEPAAAPPAKLEQTNTFSPVFQITVQGDAKDPQQLVNQMMPEIQRRFDEMAQQTARRSMSDASHT